MRCPLDFIRVLNMRVKWAQQYLDVNSSTPLFWERRGPPVCNIDRALGALALAAGPHGTRPTSLPELHLSLNNVYKSVCKTHYICTKMSRKLTIIKKHNLSPYCDKKKISLSSLISISFFKTFFQHNKTNYID